MLDELVCRPDAIKNMVDFFDGEEEILFAVLL